MTTNQDFTPEQKRYLEGFVSAMRTARAGRGLARGYVADLIKSGRYLRYIY
jgi:hypothetical protein